MKIKEITEAQMAGQYKVLKTGPEGTTLQSPDMHTMLTLDPEAAKGIVQNPTNPAEFTLSPQVATGTTNQLDQQQGGIKQGATVEVPANEAQGGGNFDNSFEDTIEDENGDYINVRIDYTITGEERPATWGYHGGEPAEHPEIDDAQVINLDTGEDISDKVDSDMINDMIWNDADKHSSSNDDIPYGVDENVGGDPTDEFIDDVRDKEFEKANEDISRIRKLSGL
jgi:hypothetical protein